ncbi:tRNA uridine(34) 5-carboxymethylaminomethyl modification radical SAM/GNAT enzyme Elp3 [Candidatus Woesearchaeota archaeon]|nr:tRNA uridine(34) 5-carboxymethylaminomethyl modification radical SAM/GNAT enzyme Elp3 [Candidatus Woesearchaeota archaeon]
MTNPFFTDIIEQIKQRKLSKSDIVKLKTKLCKKYSMKHIPSDIEILMNTPEHDLPKVKRYLMTKPTRSISGVAVVAIMCKPHECPHGRCAVCPGGPASHFGDVPQSYTGREPATMRAIRNKFDPYLQVFNRLEQYVVAGHVPDKVELIIMGGTFPSLSRTYQKNFIKYAFKAMNDFSDMFFTKGDQELRIAKFKEFFELPGSVDDDNRAMSIRKKTLKLKKATTSVESEHTKNESAKIRCVGLTLETRPDYGCLKHGNFALELGATRIEIGIESVFDDVLSMIERGHDVQASKDSIRELRDIGFKLNFHYMLGLPGSSPKRDLEGLELLFKSPDFRPDMLKIYPCMVLKGTELYKSWMKGEYRPLTTDQAAKIICEFKRSVPKYTRIMRIQRDIPTHQTEAGVDRTNLRQYVDRLCKDKGIRCRCIRCREVGRAKQTAAPRITVTEYEASGGKEFFIAAEDTKNDVLVGFTRLRFPGSSLREDIQKDAAIIRELHVYGETAALGEKTRDRAQHQGWGKRLLAKAEEICKANNKTKILIISGVGVRGYYRKLGYKKQGPYMVKRI